MSQCQCDGSLPMAWREGLLASGYAGIVAVYYQQLIQEDAYYQVHWPLVVLQGTNSDGTWSLQAGCDNPGSGSSGEATCEAICQSLSGSSRRSGSLFSAMHGSLVTSSLIRETTENESTNYGYKF